MITLNPPQNASNDLNQIIKEIEDIMRRRRHHDPQAIPYNEYQETKRKLDTAEKNYIRVMAPNELTFKQIIDLLFSQEHQKLLKDAFKLVDTHNTSGIIRPVKIGLDDIRAHIHIEFEDMLMPKSEIALAVHDTPLGEHLRNIAIICRKFYVCTEVLDWFQNNATPGAIRNYWPAILPFLPSECVVKKHEGLRYKVPHGINEHLDKIRETGEFLTQVTMAPHVERDTRTHNKISVMLSDNQMNWTSNYIVLV